MEEVPIGGTYRSVLANREFAGLLLGRAISLVGDQLARVALTVLVFDRTGSAALSAASYAVTYLPAVVAGPLLGGLADRLPRRRVLIVADLVRAGLFALMALPGVPLLALFGLVLLACAAEAPWAASRQPLVREVLVDEAGYALGTGLDDALNYSGQIIGFAGAGLLLTAVAPAGALLLDAATFLVSAVVVAVTIRPRPRADHGPAGGARSWSRTGLADAMAGWRAAMAPGCRRPLLLSWATLGCAIAPEALATPWATGLGADSVGVGLLFAAAPVGNVVAVLVVSRFAAQHGDRLLLPMALVSLLPLLLCLLDPPLPVALGLVALSGVGGTCSLLGRLAFVRGLGPTHRGRAFSIAAAGVTAAQGLGIAAAGGLALVTGPAAAVGGCGALGLVLLAAALRASRDDGISAPRRPVARHAAPGVWAEPGARTPG